MPIKLRRNPQLTAILMRRDADPNKAIPQPKPPPSKTGVPFNEEYYNRYHGQSKYHNADNPWTPQEVKMILEWTGSRAELSKKMGRSIHAIASKLNVIRNGPSK